MYEQMIDCDIIPELLQIQRAGKKSIKYVLFDCFFLNSQTDKFADQVVAREHTRQIVAKHVAISI